LNFSSIIKKVLQEFQLAEAVTNRPSLFYKLMVIARSAVLARKDFYLFEPYIIAQYQQVAKQTGFADRHLFYQLDLLYMIAHVLYRTRKFGLSLQYLEQMHEALQRDQKTLFLQFYPRYIFLKAANLAFLHRLEEATQLMENLIKKYGTSLNYRDQLTAKLGLSFFFFAQDNFIKANLVLMRLPHTDKFCENKMGKEWVLKKNLGELIIQIEMENPELAQNKVRHIERVFKELLSKKEYKNVRGYLQIIKLLLAQPDLIKQPDFLKLVEKKLTFLPLEQEDIQAISFYAWLKAKMERRRYYHVLLELSGSTVPATSTQHELLLQHDMTVV
ncbi:MAG: hypothetical protein LPK19_01805, partial [Hymenobacteraceae bacterium]|nr:hypothetical protein [Hymenobacteraceae bacterium]MDX5394910.1 hypothetical protein [Hymenobacteraceae bacterium]MDX5510945.1 hypothetical protein [Hymenobacteraceae bacterium]